MLVELPNGMHDAQIRLANRFDRIDTLIQDRRRYHPAFTLAAMLEMQRHQPAEISNGAEGGEGQLDDIRKKAGIKRQQEKELSRENAFGQ